LLLKVLSHDLSSPLSDGTTGFASGPSVEHKAAVSQKTVKLSADQSAGRSAHQPADAPAANQSSRREKLRQSEAGDQRRGYREPTSDAATAVISAAGAEKRQRNQPRIRERMG